MALPLHIISTVLVVGEHRAWHVFARPHIHVAAGPRRAGESERIAPKTRRDNRKTDDAFLNVLLLLCKAGLPTPVVHSAFHQRHTVWDRGVGALEGFWNPPSPQLINLIGYVEAAEAAAWKHRGFCSCGPTRRPRLPDAGESAATRRRAVTAHAAAPAAARSSGLYCRGARARAAADVPEACGDGTRTAGPSRTHSLGTRRIQRGVTY